MSTSTYSSSAPRSWAGESDLEVHNTWNELMVILAHHECSVRLQKCMNGGEVCRVAMSSRFALDLLTIEDGMRASNRELQSYCMS